MNAAGLFKVQPSKVPKIFSEVVSVKKSCFPSPAPLRDNTNACEDTALLRMLMRRQQDKEALGGVCLQRGTDFS